ncbi:MAG TPA: branched-chain amino acid ABC transporter permease, partial [Actinomycetota bacterium]|nr:branched-chain amino acid ABC transporter permease [Actinomycetota bacterium]
MYYVQLFILGLPIAGLFALLATGVVMVYRASRVLNLAVGGMAMFTAYIAYWLSNDPSGPGFPAGIAVVVALVFAAAQGWAIERFLLRPLRDRPILASVIMTVGALALLTALAGAIWGYDRQDAPTILPRGSRVSIAGAVLGLDRILILVITAALMAGVILLFQKTTLGVAMRAVSDDRRSALLMGIPADRVSTATWMLGSVLAGVTGILLSPIIGLQPVNLTLLAIPAYAAALFGGLTSLPYTLAGAGVVGVIYSMVPSLPVISTSTFPGARE